MDTTLSPEVVHLIKLITRVNASQGSSPDPDDPDVVGMWDAINELKTDKEKRDHLSYQDVVTLTRNLPLFEDASSTVQGWILMETEFYPYKEIWEIPFDQSGYTIKHVALDRYNLSKDNCFYFSFAPDVPIIDHKNFVDALKDFGSPNFKDVSNIFFFFSHFRHEYTHHDYPEFQKAMLDCEEEIIRFLKDMNFSMKPKRWDESAAELVRACASVGLENLRTYLLSDVLTENLPETRRKMITFQFNYNINSSSLWEYTYLDNDFSYRELFETGLITEWGGVVDPLPYDRVILVNLDVDPGRGFGPLISREDFMELQKECESIFLDMSLIRLKDEEYE